MKKFLIFLTTFMLCTVVMTGCGRTKSSAPGQPAGNTDISAETADAADIILSGKYVATQVDPNGAMFLMDAIDISPDSVSIDFREDGTLTFHIMGIDVEGTYSGSGSTGTVTLEHEDNSDTAAITLDGDKVIMSDSRGNGGKMTFEKE